MLAIRAVQLRVSSLPAVFSRSVTTVLTPLEKKYFPHLGNREIVGYGRSGVPNYCDDMACPYPAIRFRNHDEAIEALRKKEEGPWSKLTIDEVKTLYRHSFCKTLSETTAPSGMWKMGVAWGLMVITFSAIFFIYLVVVGKRSLLLGDVPVNVLQLPEYKEAVKYKKVMGRIGSVHELHNFDVKTRRFRE
ncbi:Cytochrome c oxidase subunit IV [Fasciolopsis buskii]|uniref:Cytochrome c oxidase subunit IV n=1 Tax=Fasciolopsis buskii TaxID=27845 RepID=A0A8E0S8I4_9TREM|nr:Cytochrome c oxidase subunit IV [Fasciolopsis buski]